MRTKTHTGVVFAAVALAGSLALLGAAVTRALIPSAGASMAQAVVTAEVPVEPFVESGLLDPEETIVPSRWSRTVPNEVLSMAVERAPFDPDREAPSQRYLLPGERVAPRRADPPPPERPAPPEFQILGTVASPSGGVAVVRLAGGPARVMSVGDEIEGYRVSAIESGAVVMNGQGWDMTFAVADPQPMAARLKAENERAEQASNRARQADLARRAAQGVAGRVEAVVEQLRLNGNVQVEMMNNGRAVITGPDGQRREIAIPVPPASVAPAVRARPRGGDR